MTPLAPISDLHAMRVWLFRLDARMVTPALHSEWLRREKLARAQQRATAKVAELTRAAQHRTCAGWRRMKIAAIGSPAKREPAHSMALTRPNVGRVLKAKHVPRSVSWTTAVRGIHDHGDGYYFIDARDGAAIRIGWRLSSYSQIPRENRAALRTAGLTRVIDALRLRFNVRIVSDEDSYPHHWVEITQRREGT